MSSITVADIVSALAQQGGVFGRRPWWQRGPVHFVLEHPLVSGALLAWAYVRSPDSVKARVDAILANVWSFIRERILPVAFKFITGHDNYQDLKDKMVSEVSQKFQSVVEKKADQDQVRLNPQALEEDDMEYLAKVRRVIAQLNRSLDRAEGKKDIHEAVTGAVDNVKHVTKKNIAAKGNKAAKKAQRVATSVMNHTKTALAAAKSAIQDRNGDLEITAEVPMPTPLPVKPIQSVVHPRLNSPAVLAACLNEDTRRSMTKEVVDAEADMEAANAALDDYHANFRGCPTPSPSSIVEALGYRNYREWLKDVLNTAPLTFKQFSLIVYRLYSAKMREKWLNFMLRMGYNLNTLEARTRSMRKYLLSLPSKMLSIALNHPTMSFAVMYGVWRFLLRHPMCVLRLILMSRSKMLNIALFEWGTYRGSVARQLLSNSLMRSLAALSKRTL